MARYPDITGVILTGGESSRMGQDKASLNLGGETLLKRTIALFNDIFGEVLVVSRRSGSYGDLRCREVADAFSERGSIVGVLTGLKEAKKEQIFVTACDMPFLNPEIINLIISKGKGNAVVLPRIAGRGDPIHSLYKKTCYEGMLKYLEKGEKSLNRFIETLPRPMVCYVEDEEIKEIDPRFRGLFNMNTPDDFKSAKRLDREGS